MLFGWIDENSERLTGDDAWREGVCFDDTYWFYFQSSGTCTVELDGEKIKDNV